MLEASLDGRIGFYTGAIETFESPDSKLMDYLENLDSDEFYKKCQAP